MKELIKQFLAVGSGYGYGYGDSNILLEEIIAKTK